MTREVTVHERPSNPAVLVLPHLRVQNANTISSPLTWGFPAVTAFTGLMTALERRLGSTSGIALHGVGVVCHRFEPQVANGGYTRRFCLSRNPVLADGSTAGIVEEGRAHLEISLVFDAEVASTLLGEAERARLARHVGEIVAAMRVAGDSVLPPLPGAARARPKARIELLPSDEAQRSAQFRRLARRLLPGFALVSRDDLLQSRLAALRQQDPQADLLDAWLDLSRLNVHATRIDRADGDAGPGHTAPDAAVTWQVERRPGWLVPIPVGYAALSERFGPGTVAGARDPDVPFCFVESVYSVGQWIAPHRLRELGDLVWMPLHDEAAGLYRCINDFRAAEPAA